MSSELFLYYFYFCNYCKALLCFAAEVSHSKSTADDVYQGNMPLHLPQFDYFTQLLSSKFLNVILGNDSIHHLCELKTNTCNK